MMLARSGALGIVEKVVLVALCILSRSDIAAASDVAVVASKDSRFRMVKASDLVKMIKTTHKRPDGYDLTVFLTDPSSPEMQIVAQKLLSLTPDEFKRLIDAANKSRVTFRVVSGDEEALNALQSNPAAIGLVNVYSINSNVEVLKIDGKLPLEPGYILHGQ
jgi:hypothetical protein